MEHPSANDFQVTPPVNNQNLEFRAEAIKYAEPYVRVHGQGLEMDKFNSLVSSGSLNDILSGDTVKIEESLKKLTE